MGTGTDGDMRERWMKIVLFLLPLLALSLSSVIVSDQFPFNDYPRDTDYISLYMENESDEGNCKDAGVEAIFVTFGELTLKRLEGLARTGLDRGLGLNKILNHHNGDLKEYDTWKDAIGSSEKEETGSKGRDCICEGLRRAVQLTQTQETERKNLVTVIIHNENSPCPYFDPRSCRLPGLKQRIFAVGPDGFLFKMKALYKNDSSMIYIGEPHGLNPDPVLTHKIHGFVSEVKALLGCTLPTPYCYIKVPKDAKCLKRNNDICTRCTSQSYKVVKGAKRKQRHWEAYCEKIKGPYCLKCLCSENEGDGPLEPKSEEKKDEKKGHGSLPAWVVVLIVLAVLCLVAASVVGFIYLQRRYGIKRVDEYWHHNKVEKKRTAGKEPKKKAKNDAESVSFVPTESHLTETSMPIESPTTTQLSGPTDAPDTQSAKMKNITDRSTWETLSKDTNASDVLNNRAIVAPNSGDTRTRTDTTDSMAAVTPTPDRSKNESKAGVYQNYDEVTAGKNKNGKKPKEKRKENRREEMRTIDTETGTETGETMTGTSVDSSETSAQTTGTTATT